MFVNRKKNKRSSASHKGFTLIELIVVMAIIGILAAVIVPNIIAYLAESKLSTANDSAKYVYNAVNSYAQKCNNFGAKLPAKDYELVIEQPATLSNTVPTVPKKLFEGTNASEADIYLQEAVYLSMGKDSEGSIFTVRINSYGFPTGVIWSLTDEDRYVGGYPNPADEVNWTINNAVS